MSNSPSLFNRGDSDKQSFVLYMGASVACHSLVMIMMIVLSGFSGCEKKAFSDGVIHVDLVSLQGIADGGPSERSAAYHTPAERTTEFKTPATEKPVNLDRTAISVSDQEAPAGIKTSFKKKTFDSQRVVDRPAARSEEKADNETPVDTLSDALSRLRKTVDDNQRSGPVPGQRIGSGPGAGSGAVAGSGSGQRQELTVMAVYKQEIRYHILGNWVYSDRLAGNDEGLRAVIGITIAEDGRILDIWYDDRSGNQYFDESIHKAVVKSDPLPKPPAEAPSPYTVGLKFTPSDVKSGE